MSTSNTPELAHRRGLDLADQRREVEVAPCPPGVLDQVREQHVLPARERVGLDADQPEQARHDTLDLVPQRLRLGLPRERRRLQRADHVRAARRRPSRACRSSPRRRRAARGCAPARCPARPGPPSSPPRSSRRARRRAMPAARASSSLIHGRKSDGARSGKASSRLPMSPFGSRIERRHAREERLLEQHDPEPRLAGARHPDDHAVRRQVVGLDDGRAAGGSARVPRSSSATRRVYARCAAGCDDLASPMIEQLRVEPGTEAGIASRDARDTLGLGSKQAGKERLREVGERLATLQRRLYAEAEHSVLVVLQGLDASGKDGVIKSVFSGRQPAGLPGHVVQGPDGHRARARLPLARARGNSPRAATSGSSIARTTRTPSPCACSTSRRRR